MRELIINYKKLDRLQVMPPASAGEDLMVFDARCLDSETRHELQRVPPDLTRIRESWKAYFAGYGGVSCRRKKVDYAAGGFCAGCYRRITWQMRACFRKIDAGRNIPDELASITRGFDAAQRLSNGSDE